MSTKGPKTRVKTEKRSTPFFFLQTNVTVTFNVLKETTVCYQDKMISSYTFFCPFESLKRVSMNHILPFCLKVIKGRIYKTSVPMSHYNIEPTMRTSTKTGPSYLNTDSRLDI